MRRHRPPGADGLGPADLAGIARALVEDPPDALESAWARGAALLARQALEAAITAWLAPLAPEVHETSLTARLVTFRALFPDTDLAARAAFTWSALSDACHHHGYELPPTTVDLRTWLATVDDVVTTTSATPPAA